MTTEEQVAARRPVSEEFWRLAMRAVFVAVALVLLWAESRVFFRWQFETARTFAERWGGWLWSMGLLVLAGAAFGLGAWLPQRARYRPMLPVMLGIVPLLLLIHLTLYMGPAYLFAAKHLRFLVPGGGFFFDQLPVGYALAVFLGVAIAACFAREE